MLKEPLIDILYKLLQKYKQDKCYPAFVKS